MTKWETLAPCGPEHTYITGEYYYDVYLALLRAARVHFGPQWYGLAGARTDYFQFPPVRRFYIRFRRTKWISEKVCALALAVTGPPLSVLDSDIVHIKTLSRTELGYLALVPIETSVGDSIAIYQGAKAPLVLRGDGPNKMKLVGDCYVHGIMNGEKYCEEDYHPIRIY